MFGCTQNTSGTADRLIPVTTFPDTSERRPTPQILLCTGYRRLLLVDQNGRGLKLNTHLHPVQSLRMYGAITPLPHTPSKAQDVPDPRRINTALCSGINLLKPNDIYICRTAALTSRRYILNIYSTNIHTEYFKHAA